MTDRQGQARNRLVRFTRIALLMVLPSVGHTQLVRGTVRESLSGAPVGGVVVELRSADSTARPGGATVTASDGTFAIKGHGPGRFVLVAKRIGVRRFISDAFAAASGETVVRHVMVEPVSQVLPEVVVAGAHSCATDPRSAARVPALWDEARTALLATQLSLRDSLFQGRVTRYVRQLDARALTVLGESRSDAQGLVARPFSTTPVDTVLARGFWFVSADGRYQYHGPDVDILLADAFVHDYCFEERRGTAARAGLMGLAFRPLRERTVPDLVGTVWMDARSSELRVVEFSYTRVPVARDSLATQGEVHFARLPSGAWLVARWFVRMPMLGRAGAPVAAEQATAPWILVRPITTAIQEEGGFVTVTTSRGPR